MVTTTLRVRGMRCAGCVNHVEKDLRAVAGVESASVNLATEKAVVKHDAAKAPVSALIAAVKHAGYEAEVAASKNSESGGNGESGGGDAGGGSARGSDRGSGDAPPAPGKDAPPGEKRSGFSLNVLGGDGGTKPIKPAEPAHGASHSHDSGDAKPARAADSSAPTEHASHASHRSDAGDSHTHHEGGDASHAHRHDEGGESLAPLIVGAVLTLPIVVLGMFLHHAWWSPLVQLVLAAPVQAWLGWPFYKGALRSARRLRADMDTLVALGTTVAFAYSVVMTLRGSMTVYFDTSAVILVLIGLGKRLEARARGSAAEAIRGLMSLQPPTATLLRNNHEEVVPVNRVRPGDTLIVRPGQRVPVDGDVTQGHSSIDQSMVTGESMPVEIGPGDRVIGGTLNHDGVFRFVAKRTGEAMLLAQVTAMVEAAQTSKARVQRFADAVAGVFVPVVLLIAVATLAGWMLLSSGDVAERWAHAMNATVAVLIVACPCALGLATPTAIMVGTGLGARHGILIKDAAALERAGKLTDAVLDKTGTLTVGRPEVTGISVLAIPGALAEDELLALAASAESGSEHPLGRAIVEAAKERSLRLAGAESFKNTVGGGVRATVAGRTVLVGRPGTLADHGVAGLPDAEAPMKAMHARGQTAVVVAIDGKAAGVIGLMDRLKPDAENVISRLRELGLRVVMMTGDHLAAAEAIAKPLGIANADVLAEVLPGDKQARVVALQNEGRVVAMVGDGVNDAPALASADIGIAMGAPAPGSGPGSSAGASDIAVNAGHVVLLNGELAGLVNAVTLSRATMRRIRMGLFWAFAYNVVLIPVAVAGLLHPMLAGAAMAASSVSVVGNALWLRRAWKPAV